MTTTTFQTAEQALGLAKANFTAELVALLKKYQHERASVIKQFIEDAPTNAIVGNELEIIRNQASDSEVRQMLDETDWDELLCRAASSLDEKIFLQSL